MPRTVQTLMTGWEFALGKHEDGDYQQVDLPHDWAISAPFNRNMDQGEQQGFRDRWGIGWYRKTYHLLEKKGRHLYFLEFGGVYENSTVWINGQEAGGQLYGYSTFRINITEYLKTGDNVILVKVDNTVSPVDRWYSGCGIYRTVSLAEVEEKHLDPWEIVIQTRIDGRDGYVSVDVGLEADIKIMLCEKVLIKETNGETNREINQENKKEGTQELRNSSRNETEKEPGNESGKEPGNESGKETENESGKEPGNESGKEPGNESGKEPGNESVKEPEKESGKEPGNEPEKESEKESENESGNESANDFTKVLVESFSKVASYENWMKGVNGRLEWKVPNASFWSADRPNLYELVIRLMDGERVADQITLCVGIREFVMIPERGFFVNGKREILKGVCLHQDAGCAGIAVTKDMMRDRLEKLKEMGCNSIRAAHHTHSEEFLDLCDEMGFYVYEECFDKWTGGLYGRYFKTQWKRDVDAMVKRDRNRACIFIWGVGNEVENQGQQSMLTTLKLLKEYVVSLDSTRPVTYAMNPHFKRESKADASQVQDIQKFVDEADDTEIYDGVERVKRIAQIAQIVDVISCNYQEQWYQLIHKYLPEMLILGTEVYQFFQGHYEQMQNFTNVNPNLVPFEHEYCIGSMIWTGYDYLGESMGYPAKGWSGAPIYTNGEKRPSFYILQSYWKPEPMVYFAVMDYSLGDEGVKEHWDIPIFVNHWHFPQFHKTVIPYMIASNCDEVALFLNGKRFYLPKPSACPNRLITGFIPYQPGKVEVVGYRDGVEVCRHTTVTPGPSVKLKFDIPLIKIKSHGKTEEFHERLLTVRAMDEEGNPYFRDSSRVWFQVEGEAKIAAVDNGDIKGNEPYHTDNIHMYRGSASVLIRTRGEKGRIRISAFADGMQSGVAILIQE